MIYGYARCSMQLELGTALLPPKSAASPAAPSSSATFMNAVIYARYSSSSQRDASIDEQILACEKYAQKYGYDIIEK